jgi:hypothetical protein
MAASFAPFCGALAMAATPLLERELLQPPFWGLKDPMFGISKIQLWPVNWCAVTGAMLIPFGGGSRSLGGGGADDPPLLYCEQIPRFTAVVVVVARCVGFSDSGIG